MGRFGEELRKERLSRGIEIEEITEATKISSRHLMALEQEQFRQLPGGVFNKGIVRSYARVVGLDEDAWVGRFMNAYQESGAVTDDDASWIEFAENVGKNRQGDRDQGTERLRWAGVIVLLLILAVVAYLVVGYVKKKEEFAHSSTSSETTILILPSANSQIPDILS